MASLTSHTSEPYGSFVARTQDNVQKKQRRASVQSLAKMEATVQRADKDALFASIQETNWTVADHHRLYAIDRLQTRIMEYHNNIHRRDGHSGIPSKTVQPDDVVAFFMTCSASHTDKMFQSVEKASLPNMIRKTNNFIKGKPTTGVQWMHMMDLSAFPVIADELRLDRLARDHFCDLRFHSMMTPLLGGCIMSVCYFQLDPFTLSVGMYKMYFYITYGFVLTFVAELMPDVDAKNGFGDSGAEKDAQAISGLLQADDTPVPIDAVFNAVAERWESLSERAAELGPIYVFYELASEALAAQDSLMEFLSRTIFHFKKKTSFRLSYRKKLQLVKRLHIVGTAINMVEACTSKAATVLDELVKAVTDKNLAHLSAVHTHTDAAGAGAPLTLDALIPNAVLGVRQLPVLYDLENSYNFVHACLSNEAKEVRIVAEAIDSISQMRADHTALVLSLIATIFLPATFLTGVFGMNFQENGGYTIRMVNSKWGPLVFYCLCVFLAVSLSAYYISMGWIEAFGFVRFFLNLLVGKKNMMWILGEDFEEDINDEPDVSKPKMVNVAGIVQHGASTTRGSNHSNRGSAIGGNMSDLTKTEEDGISMPDAVGGVGSVVRSPLSGDNGEVGVRRQNLLVPQRVAEALEEEAKRQEEARRKREWAQLVGAAPSTSAAAASGVTRGSLVNSYMRQSLQQRSRLNSGRLTPVGSSIDGVSLPGSSR